MLPRQDILPEVPTQAEDETPGQYVRLMNHAYLIRFVNPHALPDGEAGSCDDPKSDGYQIPEILVSNDLDEQETLEVLIHEMAHGCEWQFLSEEWVRQMSQCIGQALYSLGYRRQYEKVIR